MNTHAFDHHYVICPICQRNSTPKPVKSYVGLFTCPYCQERLVVSNSGHYVRDPFTFKQMMISSMLRRQSRPLARLIRDFVILKRPLLVLAIGGAVLFGMIAVSDQNRNRDASSPSIENIRDRGKKIQ
ncbi:MAG: hypothetical protein N2235_15880 [Fischerella sp.]|nr:hypothetical protein [Fischerella sp.]